MGKREIKYRGKTKKGDWVYGLVFYAHGTGEWKITTSNGWQPSYSNPDEGESTEYHNVDFDTIGEYTGLKDKNGKEIYEGDIIKFRQAYRSTQTHIGDNIPNGSYTEPMEPAIRTVEEEVMFKNGMFGINTDRDFMPLHWINNEFDETDLRLAVEIGRPGYDIWDSPEEGDLQYLLEEYDCKDITELLDYVNLFEVSGNIYDNREF